MKEHNFIESSKIDEYHRIIYCTKCGKVVWDFNRSTEHNKELLQNNIGECIGISKIKELSEDER